jgi:phosphoribosylformimino-5-aminoimidazole carboxamide ribotide isomerase
MQLIPVLDLLLGCVVRGVAGQRETYRPLVSRLVDSATPLTVATALRRTFGFTQMYVADLDGIVTDRPQWDVLKELAADGWHLLVDAGVRTPDRAERLWQCGVTDVVLGLETLSGEQDLERIVRRHSSSRLIFSLDLRAGIPIPGGPGWDSLDPLELVDRVHHLGITRLLVLDLTAVGMPSGVCTLELCREIRRRTAGLTLLTGGGVRSLEDLHALEQAGLDGVLIASALHDGRLTPAQVARFCSTGS